MPRAAYRYTMSSMQQPSKHISSLMNEIIERVLDLEAALEQRLDEIADLADDPSVTRAV